MLVKNHCKRYLFSLLCLSLISLSSSCDRLNSPSEPEMFGGKKDNGTFTSSIAIMRTLPDGTSIVTCTGTKIAKNMVLTAAHCVLAANGSADGKYLKPIYEPGTLQRIATGQDAHKGKKQDRKIKSVELFPGLKGYFKECTSNCRNAVIPFSKFPAGLKSRFPDIAVITYESEITDSTVSAVETFEGASPLFISGYGVNLSYSEFKKRSNDPGIDGDKRYLEFTPQPISKLISELRKSIAPLSVELLDPKEYTTEKENEINIFTQLRAPISKKVLTQIKASAEGTEAPESLLPPSKIGYTGPGDSGGGVFKLRNKQPVVVGVTSGSMREHDALPTFYFAFSVGITKNPQRNTYDWIKKLIHENGLK